MTKYLFNCDELITKMYLLSLMLLTPQLALMRLIVGGRVGPAAVDAVSVPAVLVRRHDVAELDARHVGRRRLSSIIVVLTRILKKCA